MQGNAFKCSLRIGGHMVSTSMLYHTPLRYMYVPLSTRWLKGSRGVRLSHVCVQSFSYIMHRRMLTNLPFLSYYILNSLRSGDMSPSYWCTMVSPTKLRCTAVCVAFLYHHWLEWWRAACSFPGHHPSLWWYTIIWIPYWNLMILSKLQQSLCENALKCRLQMVDSLLRPQWVIEFRHQGIRVWLLKPPIFIAI